MKRQLFTQALPINTHLLFALPNCKEAKKPLEPGGRTHVTRVWQTRAGEGTMVTWGPGTGCSSRAIQGLHQGCHENRSAVAVLEFIIVFGQSAHILILLENSIFTIAVTWHRPSMASPNLKLRCLGQTSLPVKHSKIWYIDMLIILSWKYLKNNKCW